MPVDTTTVLRFTTLLAVAAGVALVGFVGGAVADDHGAPWPADADIENASDDDYPYNFTFVPDDPTPGAEGVTYTSFSGALEPIDGTDGYDEFDTIRLFYDEGTIGCEAQDARVFGVDRGGNNSGTEVDESWIENVKESEYSSDRTYVNFFDEDDFAGEPPYIRAGDIVKSQQADCYTNPEEPGWYHVVSFSNGTYEGEYAESWVRSHPFYICDCEDEEEAREKLGPPPHERTGDGSETSESETAEAESEPTDTPEPTDGESSGGDGAADGEDSAEADGETTDGSSREDADAATGDESGGGGDAAESDDSGDDDAPRDDEAAADSEGGDGDGSAEGESGAEPTETPAPTGTDAGPAGTDADEPTEDDDGGDEASHQGTPTVDDGAGFGAVAALLAVTGAALLRRRAS